MKFSDHLEMKTRKNKVQQLFNIDVEEENATPSCDKVEEMETPTDEDVFQTPPMQAQQAP